MESSKKCLYVASTVALTGVCACAVYLLTKRKRRLLKAAKAFKLTINIVSEEENCETVVNELRRRSMQHGALGFDCEWVTKDGKRQSVALLQLSSHDGYCGLFRLNSMQTVPKSLKKLLQDDDIYKIGVAPLDDGRYLNDDYDVELNSCLDVRHIVELCNHSVGGLAHLTETLLDVVLDKHWKIRCSDWEANTLSPEQIHYAASDAHAAIKIFVQLINEYSSGGLFRPWSFNKHVWENLDDICLKYVNVNYKTQQSMRKSDAKSKEKKKDSHTKKYTIATLTKPLYNNTFLQAPDGELLCTCDEKKAQWYVAKGLADEVCASPLTVRLRFEPAGRSEGDTGRYYQLAKENRCVVCGASEHIIRKNVVPREYRRCFPALMKDHSSHDVVLLCARCHRRSAARDLRLRDALAQRCSAPLALAKQLEDRDAKRIKSAARALYFQSQKHKLPDVRRKQLEDILLQYYTDHEEVTEELLKEASELECLVENVNYEAHGVKVVDYFLQNDGLLRFEEIWREHFLQTMQPKYLPALWSITHNAERLKIKWVEGRLSDEDLKLLGPTKW